jgi:uncharacterized protein (TIGR00299 family) protein
LKVAYLDCFSGISGNMTLGALLHAGLDQQVLLSALQNLSLSGYHIETKHVKRGTISGIHCEVQVDGKQPTRNLPAILSIIEESGLPPAVKERSCKIFQLLAAAEATVHGQELTEVHFHEVGAVDSIVDIVGSVIGFDSLGIQKVQASAVNLGSGVVNTQHGTLPVPAPASVELLKGKPTYTAGPALELTTPTGAAIVAGMVEAFGGQPLMKVEQLGYGMGTADPPEWSNSLRIMIGETDQAAEDFCWMIESNIDDMNPEIYGYVMDKLFAQGALDVFLTPIIMKKGRYATRISVLSPSGKEAELIKTLFLETTAIGLRRYRVERSRLERKSISVETPFGEVSVKIGILEGAVVNQSPEYEICRKLALEKDVPLKEVYQAALRAARGLK